MDITSVPRKSDKKIAPLECLRGVAALIVFFWHFLISFLPAHSGFFNEFPPEKGLIGGLLFVPFNGLAAVSFFFVLSGFALTFHFFQTRDYSIIARGIVKRWPRLLGPVVLAILLSWACFVLGLYFYPEAAALSGSPYLRAFGFAKLPDSFTPSFMQALFQGSFLVFFKGDDFYSSVLWTMRPELLGSFLVFLLAGVYAIAENRLVIVVLSTLGILALHFIEPLYSAFIIGALIAYIHTRCEIRLSWPAVVIMLAAAVYLFGFIYPRGLYLYTADVHIMSVESLRTYMHITAGALIIIVTLGFRPLYDCLSGNGARLLGELSFPIYLIQTIVIFSFSSWFFVRFNLILSHPVLAGTDFFATLTAILAISFFFAKFDRLWISTVNRAVHRFLGKPSA